MTEPNRRKGRALLVASVGVAITTFGCKETPPSHVGNLRPVEVYLPDPGPVDAGVATDDKGAVDAASPAPPTSADAGTTRIPGPTPRTPAPTIQTPPPKLAPPVGNLRPVEIPAAPKK